MRPGYHGAQVPIRCQATDNNVADPSALGNENAEKCPQDPYQVIAEDCDYWDMQELKIQELPEDVPLGDMPRHV